jgi:hypothetical protein
MVKFYDCGVKYCLHISMKRFCILFMILLIITNCKLYAQIVVTPTQTATQLVQKLVGAGVTVANPTLTCPTVANGTFSTTSSNLGLKGGILLTTGTAVNAVGAASLNASTNNNALGDADLTAIINATTRDACVLEFDFVPTGDTVKFRYVFGSKEYPGYACTNFNDVFAFFISGPGYNTPKNIALIPGTTIPVAINSTSGVVGTAGGNITTCNAMGTGSPFTQYYVNNVTGTTVRYSGFTTIFTALATVIPCNTYHLKLAVADAIDGAVDSGVFLEEGSLTSNELEVSTKSNIQAPVPYCVRGCKNGSFKFKRQKVSSFPLTVKYLISGTAVNGTDYTAIPDSVVIPANDSVAIQTIVPLTTASGSKIVKLYVFSPFSCTTPLIIDSSEVAIFDSLYADIATSDTSVCPGTPAQIITIGDDSLVYSWTPSLGLSSTTAKSPFASPTSATTYFLTATLPNSTCLPIHDQINVGVNLATVINTEPVDKVVCVGSGTTFGVLATGTNLNYQWQLSTGSSFSNLSNNGTYSGVTTNTLTVANAIAGMNSYKYRCIVSGVCQPKDTSAQVVLTVNTLPVITSQPVSHIICEGSNTSFSVTATGSAVAYQWMVNDGNGFVNVTNTDAYNGATTATLSITNTPVSLNGYLYKCFVSGACTPSLNSNTVSLTVNALLSISGQPGDRNICTGGNTTFSVTAGGTGIAYQWQVNNGGGFTNVTNTGIYSGANTGVLSITNATTSVDGFKYRCLLTGTCLPNVITDTATLRVGVPPAITSQPTNTPICDGGTTIFSIGATGTNLTYQWQVNTGSGYVNINNGGVYSGANSASLVITAVSASMSGYLYQCVVSGDCPPAVTSGSLSLVLTVYTLPSINTQPVNSTICEGDNTSFGISATGSGITYQWYVDVGLGYGAINNSGVYSGATTNTLSITGATRDMSGYKYKCIVPGTCLPDAISAPAYLTVDTIPVVQNGPLDTTVCDGSPASFSIDATGTAKTYQWQLNSGLGFNNVPNGGIYSGANTATLHMSAAIAAMEGYQYRCIVNGTCPPFATSPVGVLHIDLLPAITSSPADSAICYNGDAAFFVGATGTGLNYQWQVDNGGGFVDVNDNSIYTGATTSALMLVGAPAGMNGYRYRCVVSGNCTPPATSASALLTVYTAPHVVTPPTDRLICDGGSTSFSIAATGAGLTYQWQQNDGSGFVDIINNSPFSGATTNTLGINPGTVAMHHYSFRCIVTGTCNPEDTSAAGILNVNTLPAITSQPHDSAICEGNAAAFNAAGTGTNITYRWQVNTGGGFQNINDGGVYSGAFTPTLQITGVPASMNGYKYRGVLTGDCNPPGITSEVILTVNTPPLVVVHPHDSTVCFGSNASFAVSATGSGLAYLWQVDIGLGYGNISNGGVYSGANTNTLLLTNPTSDMNGYRYRCFISGTCPPDNSSTGALLTVNTLPEITSQTFDSTVCEGESAAFAIAATGTNISYQWQVSGGGSFVNISNTVVYSGTQTNTLVLTAPPAAMNGYQYRCVVSGVCLPQQISIPVLLTVNSRPGISLQPRDSIICEGGNAAFIMQATGTSLIYRWQVDDGNGYVDVADNALYSGTNTNILFLTTPSHTISGYQYRCILSGICTPIDTTLEAALTIYELPVLLDQPVSRVMCEGDDTYFAAPASGTGVIYQWEVNTGSGFVAVNDGGVYSGANTDTLKITNSIASLDGNIYRCHVSGNCPPDLYSNSVPLTVNVLPLINMQPHDTTICTGNNASFAIAATGTNISYQWQVDNGTGFTDVVNGGIYSGATTPVLNITAANTAVDSYRYRCVVPGTCMPDEVSDTVTLYISTPPAIISSPTSTPICDGGTTIFSVGATGTNLVYQWQVNTGGGYVNINNTGVYSGANTASLVISGVTPAMTGYQYQCIISGDCPPAITSGSLTLVLTVYTLPAITSQPVGSVTICEGNNTSFNISAIGSGISYEWQVDTGTGYIPVNNTGVYSGANTPTLNITSATYDMSGNIYRCVVPGICLPDAISTPVNLRVDTIPAVLSVPLDTTVCDGDAASFSIVAIGTGRTYQWQLNSGLGFSSIPNSGIYSGANTPTLYISATTAIMEGYQYRCIVNGICPPAATSPIGVLHIKLLPAITIPPANTIVCDGGNAAFSITAIGTGLMYQWEEDAGSGFVALADNVIYSGTSTASLQVSGVVPSMNGYHYRCIATGACAPPAISAHAILTVNTLPDITMQPHDSLICDGGNASFNIAATGTATTYQWQVNAGSGYINLTNNAPYTGTATNTLLITGGQASMHNYTYRCIVSGYCTPPDTSLAGVLMVNTLPLVTLQPHDSIICNGGNAAFIINGTGTGVTYQWQINTGSGFSNLPNGGVYSGALTNTLQITGASALMNGYRYRCVLTGDCSPQAISGNALLTVNIPPALTLQPHDSTICDGNNASFTIAATGTALTYQWQINTGSVFINLPNAGIYSGATTNTLQITGGNAAMNGYKYRCIVSGVCPPAQTSAEATLFINTLPAVTTQPTDSTICDGNNSSFSITATGTGISYQWQVNNGTGFVNVINNSLYSGASSATLSLTAANAAMHNYQYRCIVTGTCTPPAVSNMALLKVNTLPLITTQPKDSTICEGLDASFKIAATGTGITYKWQLDNGSGYFDVVNNSLYSGATTNTLVLTGVPFAMDGYQYRCIVSGTCTPPDTSLPAAVHINTSPVVTMNPSGSTICENTNTAFSINATGTGLLYQWQVNVGGAGAAFTDIVNSLVYAGSNTSTLSITAAVAGMNTYTYRCIVNGTCMPPDTSLTAMLLVETAPLITQSPVGVSICPRTNTMFEVQGNGTAIAYQWQVNDGNGFVDIVNNATYTGAATTKLNVFNTDKSMDNYKYRCIASGTCYPWDTSSIAILTIYPEASPVITTNKANAEMCAGEMMLLTGSPATGVTYQWYKNGQAISSETNATYTTMVGGVYKLIVYNNFCYTTSDSVFVVVHPLPAAAFHIEGLKIICPDSEVMLQAVNILQSTYQWKYNGNNIPGALSDVYKTSVPGIYSVEVINNYGCASVSESRDILSDPGPNPRITSSDIILCTGNFKAYQWYRYSDSVLTATSACFAPKSNGVYSVFVTNDNGCSKLSDPFEMDRVGHSYVLISPNPSSSIVYINTSLVVNVVLSTMDGKILLRQDRAKQIDISGFADGEYMLWVFDQQNDAVRAERIVKISGK